MYETHVQPFLSDIQEWYQIVNEGEIARRLGIRQETFCRYKKQHKELAECLRKSREILIEDLKKSLRMKAKGFHYTETKRVYQTDAEGKQIGTVEVTETEKYAQPDTGAIHLLLKNLDKEWRNDDQTTIDLRREKLELDKQRTDAQTW